VEQTRFNIRISTASAHEGNGEEGASLGADEAAIVFEFGLIFEDGFGINLGIVSAKAFARIDKKIRNRQRIYLSSIGSEVSKIISARANRLRIVRGDTTSIISGMS
jgi:hypothetical protein